MEIVDALKQLDPSNDEHWTTDGLPKVDEVAALVDTDVSRTQISDAFPGFNRSQAEVPQPGDSPSEEEAPATFYEQCVNKAATLNLELNEVAIELEELNNKRKALEIKIHAVSGLCDKHQPRDAGQQNITDYLKRQKQIARNKADRRKVLQDAGVGDLMKGLGKAPIDEAMNKRKPGRGSQRPVIPAK